MKKLLIVDDDKDLLEAMEVMFLTKGFQVVTTLKAEAAHEIAQSFQPNLIIVDYLLSGVLGTEICQGFKEASVTSRVPIIIVSAHPEANQAAMEAGADDFVAKPFTIDQMMQKVSALIGG